MLDATSIAERAKVSLPAVSVFSAAGRAVVPVVTYEAYGSAIALVRSVAADIGAVTARRGPLVPPSRLDTWLDKSTLIGQQVMPTAIVHGALGTLVVLLPVALHSGPWTNPIPEACYWALGSLSFVSFWAGIYMRRADIRIAKHKERVKTKRFAASDVDAMLASFINAPLAMRAATRAAVADKTEPMRGLMDAYAVARLDAVLAGATEAPADARLVEAARLAAKLVGASPSAMLTQSVDRFLAAIENPDERSVIAKQLAELSDAKKSA